MKRSSRASLLTFALLFLVSATVTGCATSYHYEKVAYPPKPQLVAWNKGGGVRTIHAGILRQLLRESTPTLKVFAINDKTYLFMTKEWFFQMLAWTEKYIKDTVPELYSKEELPPNYTEVFRTIMHSVANGTIARHYNVKASVLIGLVAMKSVNPWGPIPGDGRLRHYIVALTEKGGLVHDLHSDQTVEFNSHPNRYHIVAITF
ncbi:MAG: hypothetical protein GY774_11435 [Planctomycetes bacterium]|nr:hypothetical protein [Planctomycetota bacterium]